MSQTTTEPAWAFYDLDDLKAQREQSGKPYLEFLRTPTLSMGLYVLKMGVTDLQAPHTRDETYHILRGRAMCRIGDEERPIQAGTILFIRAGVEHRFHSITEDLDILVFFEEASVR